MEAVIAFLLVVAVAAFVAWPLLTREPPPATVASAPRSAAPWERQKQEAYAAIKEAEFDHQMGKLTDADFSALQHKYREQALTAIAAMQATMPTPIGKAGEGRKPSRIAFCPMCGRNVPPRANFCPGCGIELRVLKDAVA